MGDKSSEDSWISPRSQNSSSSVSNTPSVSECELFTRGFGSFLGNGYFSDVTVVTKIPSKTFELHKVILAYSSKYFRKYFDELEQQKAKENENATSERKKDCVELVGPFGQYFHLVVGYMYDGLLECSSENVIPLLAMANFYQIKGLKKEASAFLAGNITRDNALLMLQKAIFFDAEDVTNKCINVICKHFNQLASATIAFNNNNLTISTPAPNPITSVSSSSNSATLSTSPPLLMNYSTSSHLISPPKSSENSTTQYLHTLPLPILLRILRQHNLAVSSEYVVYQTVCAYINHNKTLLSQDDINGLFETVRFPWMSYQQLSEVEKNPLVPHSLLTEALFVRLKQHEAPKEYRKPFAALSDGESSSPRNSLKSPNNNNNTSESDNEYSMLVGNRRLIPRAQYAVSLQYTSDFDDQGLFYYIGTNGGIEEWSNPFLKGRVRVMCSSQEKGNVADVVGRTPTECWTMDVPASWISVSIGSNRTLVPNYYTLRHGGNSRADCLRNWTLQGSLDSKNWTVLARHAMDTSLNGNFATCSWAIPDCKEAYRFFRVVQTGRNSSNHNFLSLSGIEFYGDLYENRKQDGYNSP
eukprot:TRINITY_DN7323_c0_g1_i1.p1 TRINITY_DN7323_c0_g1~~TRINITY_DN7323_c0_g1_i1.p1  ORF type:complete len:585 (-),score=125.19 TRINITY_DN7323_c0_g1_i1:96-1850(-)